ncbi:MAG: LPXTG cell wall anchor domain-containing protein [Turicibacter sp.]|nr:LPXTG cell wall anchor domain-containing protein [Turicibacter sp.]
MLKKFISSVFLSILIVPSLPVSASSATGSPIGEIELWQHGTVGFQEFILENDSDEVRLIHHLALEKVYKSSVSELPLYRQFEEKSQNTDIQISESGVVLFHGRLSKLMDSGGVLLDAPLRLGPEPVTLLFLMDMGAGELGNDAMGLTTIYQLTYQFEVEQTEDSAATPVPDSTRPAREPSRRPSVNLPATGAGSHSVLAGLGGLMLVSGLWIGKTKRKRGEVK